MLTNLGFWAVFGVVLFFICLFLMFIPDTWRGRLVVFGLCCVIAFASASLMYFTATNSQERWNDGRHTEVELIIKESKHIIILAKIEDILNNLVR